MPIHRHWLILATSLLAVGWLYHSVLGHGFVWDDYVRFINNPSLRVGELSADKVLVPLFNGSSYLRPLVLLSFALEYHWVGVEPPLSHGINLAFHLGSTALVFAIAYALLQANKLDHADIRAGLAALIYGVHPALVESVAWMSGRYDLMGTFFILLALAADIHIRTQWRRTLALAISFALALGCKEVAVTLPPLLLLLRLARDRGQDESLVHAALRILQKEWPAIVALGAVFAAYVGLRIHVFGAFMGEHEGLATSANGLREHALLVLHTLGVYTVAIFAPVSTLPPIDAFHLPELYTRNGIVHAALGLVVLVVIARLTARAPLTGLLLLAGLIGLLPVLHFVPLTIGGNLANDRFLTLPLVFCAIAATSLRLEVGQSSQSRMHALLALGVALIWTPMAANSARLLVPIWRSDLTLWSWVYELQPGSPRVQSLYLGAALRERRYDLLKPAFDRIVTAGPMEVGVQLNYASYLLETGELDEAEKYIRGALVALPVLHEMTADVRESVARETNLQPNVGFAYSSLARIARERGDYKSALEYIDISLSYQPGQPEVSLIKCQILVGLDRVEEANTLLEHSLQLLVPQAVPLARARHQRFVAKLCGEPRTPPLRVCALPAAGTASNPGR